MACNFILPILTKQANTDKFHLINELNVRPTVKENPDHFNLSFICCNMERGISQLRKINQKVYYDIMTVVQFNII